MEIMLLIAMTVVMVIGLMMQINMVIMIRDNKSNNNGKRDIYEHINTGSCGLYL